MTKTLLLDRRRLLIGAGAAGVLLPLPLQARGTPHRHARRAATSAMRRLNKTPTENVRLWINFGADPAYPTTSAALKDAERVFKWAGWPADAAKDMSVTMNTTQGEEVELQPGDTFDFMRSGANQLWGRTKVAFKAPGKDMVVKAKARRWTLELNGLTYVAILPGVCNNLAGLRVNDCVYIDHEATQPRADKMLWARFVRPDDQCFEVRQISELGQPDDGKGWEKPILNRLCDGFCSMEGAECYYQRPMVSHGHFDIDPGLYQIRLARGEKMAFCVETPGADKPSSFMNAVDWDAGDYVERNGVWRATVRAVPQTMPGARDYLNRHDLFYWARNAQEEAKVNEMALAKLRCQ